MLLCKRIIGNKWQQQINQTVVVESRHTAAAAAAETAEHVEIDRLDRSRAQQIEKIRVPPDPPLVTQTSPARKYQGESWLIFLT